MRSWIAMLAVVAGSAPLATAGCTTPAVTSATPDGITIRYDPMLAGRAEIGQRANSHCIANGGSGARFVSSSTDGPLGFRYDVFACDEAADAGE